MGKKIRSAGIIMRDCIKTGKKVSVYLRNQFEEPSSYYRIFQYIAKIDKVAKIHNSAPLWLYRDNINLIDKGKIEKNIKHVFYYIIMLWRITFFILSDILSGVDTIIVLRQIMPRYSPFYIRFLLKLLFRGRRVIWDFDDNIFVDGEIDKKEAALLFKSSKLIIVTNKFLKKTIPAIYKNKAFILPTTDGDAEGKDIYALNKKRKELFKSEIRLVWVGTGGNIPYLNSVIKALDAAAEEILKNYLKKPVLYVVSNKRVKADTKFLLIKNIKWSRHSALKLMENSHIGIMPLMHNNFTVCKGGFKLIQYMAVGLPVIADDVGINSSIVQDDVNGFLIGKNRNEQWKSAVLKLSNSFDEWSFYSKNAIEVWNRDFSYNKNLNFWNKILN